MSEMVKTIAGFVAEIGLEAGKRHLNNKVDEKKLRRCLIEYIERQNKYNEVAALSQEIDFQALAEYILNNFIEEVERRVFCVNPKERANARDNIVSAAVNYSQASTEPAKQRVERIVCSCLDIIREFYRKDISKQDYIVATQIVDSIDEKIDEAKEEITNKIDSLVTTGSMYSLESFVDAAQSGDFRLVDSKLRTILKSIEYNHPLYPYYGFSFDETLKSVPLIPEATKMYPPRFKFTGALRAGNKYFNEVSDNPFDYAYRHQTALVMEVSKAKRYLGDVEDPAFFKGDNIVGGEIMVHPPKFPPAFRCEVKVGANVFYSNIMMRTQQILDDGTYIFGNREQKDVPVYFEVKVKLDGIKKYAYDENDENEDAKIITKDTDFNVSIHDAANSEYLNFVKFMKALSSDKDLSIYVVDEECPIVEGIINDVNYVSGFTSIEEEIDFFERICAIEDYYHVKFDIHGDIGNDDYKVVLKISDLIRNNDLEGTWTDAAFTGKVDANFREGLAQMGSEISMLSYVGVADVEIFGARFEVRYMRTFKSAVIKEPDRVRQLVSLLKDGESIRIELKPGEDKTVVDTINLPDGIEGFYSPDYL